MLYCKFCEDGDFHSPTERLTMIIIEMQTVKTAEALVRVGSVGF